MTKSIQQQIEEQRKQSQLGKVTDAHINRIIGISARTSDPTWQKANSEKNSDPEIRQKLAISQKSSWSNNKIAEKRKQGMRDFWESDEGKKFAKEKHTSDTFREAIAARSTPEFCAKVSEKKKKPIHVAWGDFPSKMDAVVYAKENGIKDPARKIEKGLKSDPSNFYYK